jgi:hypothetical protein
MDDQRILYLLKPGELPKNWANMQLDATSTSPGRDALAQGLHFAQLSSETEALDCLRKACEIIPMEATPTTYDQSDIALPDELYERHDEYFCISRVTGTPAPIFIQSLLHSYYELIEEAHLVGTYIDNHEWIKLCRAYNLMLYYLYNGTLPDSIDGLNKATFQTPTHTKSFSPMYRWRIGHHIFAVMVQSLIIAFNCFASAINIDDQENAAVALELAAHLMAGSGASLRFTGSFRNEDYSETIRPSMPLKFSGLQAFDHRYLVGLLTKLKPVFRNSSPMIQDRLSVFTQSLDSTYEAHKLVCSRFMGNRLPSLRMNITSEKTAIDVISQLKHSRLRLIKTEASVSE